MTTKKSPTDEIRRWMSRPVLTLTAGQPASDALATMRAEGVRHAVVLRGKAIAGVVSDRDLGGAHGGRARKGKSVGELMQPDVVVASPRTTTAEAAAIVRDRRIGCLPVVERGRLVGIVTRTDLLARLAEGLDGARRRPRSAGAAEIARAPHDVSPNVERRI